ncbi:AraC family transcriptional regulator [Paenibacillus koleovorans]|uniref:AraC family transcriptional regulator n=1 Tax=Paenibacillus koleovorans TaxID=121608 RepID=UPI0013E28F20|nr:helix-turn-helix domain-containing protein [Paenibacillus koleovorans]
MFTFAGHKKRLAMTSYVKILLSFVIVVLATNVAMSSSMYVNYERHAVNLVQKHTVEELSQISYSTNFMFEAAKQTLQQLYLNPAVLTLMNYTDLEELEAASLLRQVGIVNINMPLVNSIYIYNKKAEKVYYDGKAFPLSSFPDQDIISRLNAGQVQNLRPLARRIPSPVNYTNTVGGFQLMDNVYSFVFVEGNRETINSAIILNVSQEWMKNTIESMNPETSVETVIVDSSGLITLSNERFEYLDNLNRYMDFSSILTGSSQTGFIVKSMENKKVLISYVKSGVLDWKYIRFTPYESVSGKLKRLLLVTLVIFVLVTIVSVLAVMFLSRAVYGFFNRRMKELEKKYIAEKDAGYEKKQRYLRTLATREMEEGLLKRGFARYGIVFDLDQSFMTLVLRIDRYADFCLKYSLEDRALLSYGLINIIGELTGPKLVHEAVELGDGYFGILFNLSSGDDEAFTVKMEGLVKEIQEKAQQFLGVSLSVALGDWLDEFAEIPGSVALGKETLDYRLFYGPRSVLYVSSIKEMKKKEFVFPETLLAELLEQLKAGDKEAMLAGCTRLMDGLRGYSIRALQTTILQLALSTKEYLKKNSVFADEIDYVPFIEIANRITQYETLEEITGKVQELFEGIYELLTRSLETVKRQERYSGIMDHVTELLEKEYANPNLSPELMAEHFGISAKYLRTLYKKASGESLGDNINRYRMERAKEWLERSEYSVQEIAQRSGFVNINYFYTLFKKYNGITPNEYRSLHLTEGK